MACHGDLLPQSFFGRPSDVVAPDLVGKILWREGVGGGRLVEVEAYLPTDDPASHAYRGRSPRNAAMFGPPGHLYVYLSYGVHNLVNLVCDREGVGSAVLIRAFEPMGDLKTMRVNRGDVAGRLSPRDLTSGPGRVGQALGLDRSWNRRALGRASGICVLDDGTTVDVARTTRVGISVGVELPLRYILDGSAYVSRAPRMVSAQGPGKSGSS
ncbi:MAG: DNA-3-methyladenine glycosylase [Thermoleophilia bacterium]|nr:DNA-3-methyladenine glycosylase [Thermoleophilia bacterium]